MTGWTSHIVDIAVGLAFALILFGMVCSFIRMVRGPSLPDRVVALDMLTILMLAFVGVYSVAASEAVFLDVGIALALIAFLGTVAFARYAERRDAYLKGIRTASQRAIESSKS